MDYSFLRLLLHLVLLTKSWLVGRSSAPPFGPGERCAFVVCVDTKDARALLYDVYLFALALSPLLRHILSGLVKRSARLKCRSAFSMGRAEFALVLGENLERKESGEPFSWYGTRRSEFPWV